MIPIILLSVMLTGCETVASKTSVRDPSYLLNSARAALEEDQIYIAKSETQALLEAYPDYTEAEELMAEIIDREIARQMERIDSKALEEYSEGEKADEIKTWLERARTLLSVKQYDEAVMAAERVFILDPQNLEASRMIDEIKKEAIREGKEESLVLKKIYQSEIDIRVKTYTEQSRKWIKAGRPGAAKLAVEKILLLEPENKEALQMYEEIKERQNETGKAL